MCYIVVNADRKVIVRFCFAHFIEDGFGHPRSKLLRAKAKAATDDTSRESNTFGSCFAEGFHHIQVEWFTGTARFLCTIQDSNDFDRLWYRLQEMFNREGTEQAYFDHSHLLTPRVQVLYCCLDRLGT